MGGNAYDEVQTSLPQNVTLFGDRVFIEAIKLERSHRFYPTAI